MDEITTYDMEGIQRLTKDLREASRVLSDQEVRFLVDGYYSMQRSRIVQDNRRRAMGDAEPHGVIDWFSHNAKFMENQVKAALDRYSENHAMGAWVRGVHGIGPVIAAGLLAHIDIHKAKTAGAIWRFAGLDPTLVWKKKTKRPYNAALKNLCWKAGESFKKFSNDPKCVYGKMYRERKELEVQRNEAGMHVELCKSELERRGATMTPEQKAYYVAGRLPPGRLDLRATRYATKQFLSDFHAAWYLHEFGHEPPLPYPIQILGHAHFRNHGRGE